MYLIEVQDEEIVKKLNPKFELLENSDAKAIIITSKSNSDKYDFVSRFFAPGVGINEDPVTGSAHCSLAPYWGNKLGKNELIGFQASARTGIVRCIWIGNRVVLKGRQ
ncbi:phenazine biosynthesis protein PhzF family [Desulfosporosinus hippei DSM 8344]|uniref:Phenazine biosynthesis protein PhzF family n=1 Tax=Desulfosporosinus hippei DSM 8344 TaxID=1121419 RepID=A0A1G8BFC4_9FIRM|nr:phenazine biosynthesis protein PhzF family [Desulfosporosinus hippei DSM 8344]